MQTEIEIEEQKITPQDREDLKNAIPKYKAKLELTSDKKKSIVEEIKQELKEIMKEREDDGFDKRCDSLERQYEGKMQNNDDQQFNVHRHTTKAKVDAVVRNCKAAYLESDPIYSVTPRPEFDRVGGEKITDRQSDFLDYKLDEVIPLEAEEERSIHFATLCGVGVTKLTFETKREKKVREEIYEGKNVIVMDQKGRPVPSNDPSKPLIKNQALEDFASAHPEGAEKYPGIIKKIAEGKTVSLMISYKELVYNDPLPKAVDPRNFYCRKNVDNYEDLKRTRLTVERTEFSWWELKRLERDNEFYDIDELAKKTGQDKDKEPENKENFENQMYNIMECVFWTTLDGEDEETKCVFWYEEESKVMIGSTLFPYHSVDCYYIPHFIDNKKKGWYKRGLAEFLTDSNIAENAILNFTLEGAWASNMVTPIVPEGSDIENQFLEKRWTHGIPIAAKKGEIDFLNKYMKPTNVQEMLVLMGFLLQGDDTVTGITEGFQTGRADPVDPQAPASKTIALLERSGINVKDYIKSLVPAFNIIANIILQLYYQHCKEGAKFRTNPERVVGSPNPFDMLSRSDMAAKTNVQTQALAFNFHKLNEKKEDLGLYQMIRQEPLVARNPEAVYQMMKAVIKGWSPKWKNRVDSILPSIEQFKAEQKKMAVMAVAKYVQATLQESQMTGQPPAFDPRELMGAITQGQTEIANPTQTEQERVKK